MALAIASPHTVTLVPPLKQQNDEDQEKGKRRYEAQKASRDQASDHLNVTFLQVTHPFAYLMFLSIKIISLLILYPT